MKVTRTIIGIGELLLARLPQREGPGGLAVETALTARRLGYRGVPVSRIGQDSFGERLLTMLHEREVDVAHLQSDPDLPTGRLTVRSLAGRITRSFDDRAAFDNLQWDFDLEDLAQTADAVIFSSLARRGAQARTTIDRFLDSSRQALLVFNLTTGGGFTPDRLMVTHGLTLAHGAVLDAGSIGVLAPGNAGDDSPAALRRLVQQHDLAFVLFVGPDGSITATTADQHAAMSDAAITTETCGPGLVGLVHGLLEGWDWEASLRMMSFVAQRAAQHETDPIPRDLPERGVS